MKKKVTKQRLQEDLLFMECNKNNRPNRLKKSSLKQLENMLEKCRARKDIDCKYFLQKKIRMNMRERYNKGWSVPQSLAISYSQVKKMYPTCLFKRKKKSSSPQRKKVVRIKVQKGGLHGYSLKLNLVNRRKALHKLVSQYGWGNIVKKLNVLYIYNKNNHPVNALKFRRDMKYVQKMYNKK